MPPHLCQHDGKLCVSRLVRCSDSIGTSPFVTLHIQAGMNLMGLIKTVACCYEDLVECWEHTPWWVVPIHKSCASSPSKIFQSQHLLLILGADYWHFRLRPQGIIELVCGEGSLQFVTTLPKNANKDMVLDLLAAVLPPPNLQFLIRVWLNGVELLNKLTGMTNGFYGVRGEACWIVHNGEPVLSDQLFLGQGDVVIVWQKYDHEMSGSTAPPIIARAIRGCWSGSDTPCKVPAVLDS